MRILLAAGMLSLPTTTSNRSESDDIQLEIIYRDIQINLAEQPLHLGHGESDAFMPQSPPSLFITLLNLQ